MLTGAESAPVRGPEFDQIFWNQFVHDTLERPTAPRPLRRLTEPPLLYLKTVDEAGQPVDGVTLQTVEEAMRAVASTWSGGHFGLVGVERGIESREGKHGWVTVKWVGVDTAGFCGTALMNGTSGWIALNYLHRPCWCSGSRISATTARHEVGHVFGYWHTDGATDVMRATGGCADRLPSAREVYHAKVAYESPNGSLNSVPGNSVMPTVDFQRASAPARMIVD